MESRALLAVAVPLSLERRYAKCSSQRTSLPRTAVTVERETKPEDKRDKTMNRLLDSCLVPSFGSLWRSADGYHSKTPCQLSPPSECDPTDNGSAQVQKT